MGSTPTPLALGSRREPKTQNMLPTLLAAGRAARQKLRSFPEHVRLNLPAGFLEHVSIGDVNIVWRPVPWQVTWIACFDYLLAVTFAKGAVAEHLLRWLVWFPATSPGANKWRYVYLTSGGTEQFGTGSPKCGSIGRRADETVSPTLCLSSHTSRADLTAEQAAGGQRKTRTSVCLGWRVGVEV